MKLWGAAILAALLVIGTWLVVRGRPVTFRSGVVAQGSESATAALQDFGAVPDFTLVSQTGDTVRSQDLRGPWIADFMFTTCGSICPVMSAQFEQLSTRLDDRVRLVSFSVDPERDTPERLAEYAARYGAVPARWLFLTGEKADVRRLVQDGFRLGVDDAAPEDIARGADTILHSTRFVLVDANARIRGYYDSTEGNAMKQLEHDVERLLAENVP